MFRNIFSSRTILAKLVCFVLMVGSSLLYAGCGGDESVSEMPEVVDDSTPEVVEITNSYEGDDIYFEVDGIFYEGHVTAHVSADEIHVLLDDHSKMVISIEQMGASLIADHPDVGVEVVLQSDRDGEILQYGSILAGYGNGTRKIKIDKVELVDGEIADLDPPRILYVHEDAGFLEGGVATSPLKCSKSFCAGCSKHRQQGYRHVAPHEV